MKKLLLTIAAVLTFASAAKATPQPPPKLAHVLHRAFGHGRDYRVSVCVAWNESRFRRGAVSKTGDYGVMQINHAAHPGYSTWRLTHSLVYNVRAARAVKTASGWRAWTTYRNVCWRVA